MSGIAAAVQRAAVAALRGGAGLEPLTGVHDGPPARAPFPYATIDLAATDWSHKTANGRELRVRVTIWDEGARAARLHGLMAAAEAAIEAIPRALEGGGRIASVSFVRSRVARDADGPWAGLVEYRLRAAEG